MRVAVVYESWFGNTREIAEAIAGTFRSEDEVTLFSVDDPCPAVDELDLLVVGAPTHMHGLSNGPSRKAALEQLEKEGAPGLGARGWLDRLPDGGGLPAAAFDTRLGKPAIIVGSAARGIAKRLGRHGFQLVVPPESFFIRSDNSLEEGELERAAVWAERVANAASAAATSAPV